MKAIRVSEYGGPTVLRLEEIPTPQPGPNQVLVRIHAVGVNPVDTYLRSNTDNRGPKLPYTPGSDAAGVVEVVGSGVTQVKVGDRIYLGGTSSGAYAELCLSDPGQLHPLPANATFAQGAAMNVPYATAYQALFNRAHGQAGETVLVHGASGGVGIAAVQLARARGLTVIGTAGTERGRKLVLSEGAHHVLDHTAPGYLDECVRLTGRPGAGHHYGDVGQREPPEGPRHHRHAWAHCRHRQPRRGRDQRPLCDEQEREHPGHGPHSREPVRTRRHPRGARGGAAQRLAPPGDRPGAPAQPGRAQPRGGAGAGAPREGHPGAVRRR